MRQVAMSGGESREARGRRGDPRGSGVLLAGGATLLVLCTAVLAATREPTWVRAILVLVHPLLGLALIPPFALWWWRRRTDRLTFAAGWLLWGSVAAAVALVVFAGRSGAGQLLGIHVALAVAGLGLLVLARRPIGAGVPRRRWRMAVAVLALALLAPLVARAFGPANGTGRFANPAAYASMDEEAMNGASGPFHPAGIRTTTGAPLPAGALPPATSCGGAGCHEREVAEWSASPHRWAGTNPWYRVVREDFVRDRGEAAAAWCAGCHEPSRLLTGGSPDDAAEGVSCAVCHRATGVASSVGQGQIVVAPPPAVALAGSGSPSSRALHRWLIRLDPETHRRAWTTPATSGEVGVLACAACHKSHLDAPVNGHRWVQYMNDYDQWQASSVSGHGGRSFHFPEEPRTCVGCHMSDGAGGPSHRFAAANGAVARLSGDPEQLAAVERFLAGGAVTVDLFALAADDGEAVPLDRGAVLPRGGSVRLDVVVATPGVGHLFPGGKLHLSDVWLELVGIDAAGRTLFESGRPAPDGTVGGGAHRYGVRLIDGHLRALDRGEDWAARAEIYRTQVLPLAAEVVRYRLEVPPWVEGPVTLEARLRLRGVSGTLHRHVRERLGAAVPAELPVSTVAEARATVDVDPTDGEPGAAAGPEIRRRWNDYGIGLLLAGDLKGARSAFGRVTELDPGYVDGWVNLARTAIAEGDLEGAAEAVGRAQSIEPDLARTLYYVGRLEQLRGDAEAALSALRRAAAEYPADRIIRLAIFQILMVEDRPAEVLEEIDAVLAIDPEWALAHYNAMLAHRALGDESSAGRHQALYDRFRVDDGARALSGPYVETHPDDNRERQPIHEHPTAPAEAVDDAADRPHGARSSGPARRGR